MKTSTKLLLSALIIFIVAVGIYNNALKAEFLTGNYKKQFGRFNAVNIKGFSKIEINGVNMMDVELKQGDFAVYKGKGNEDSVKFTLVGDKLIVNVDLKEKPPIDTGYSENENGRKVQVFPDYRYRFNRIAIVCPNLKALQTSDIYLLNGKVIGTQQNAKDPFREKRQIDLKMFRSDSLQVIQYAAGTIDLQGNMINFVNAEVNQNAAFVISGGNLIQKAKLTINKHGELTMGNITIPDLTYHFADSTKVSLNGASLKSFIKQ